LEVRYLGALADGMGKYEMRWYNPVPGGEYRFVINARGGHSALISPVFVCNGRIGGADGETALAVTARH
jgi:hypothetical protein